MLNFGDNVDRNKLSTSTLSPVCIRTSDKVEDRLVKVNFIPASYLLGQLFEVGLGPSGLIQK